MNRVTAHMGSKYPIIQAPMGWIARSQLASAVCEAGGMGIIETSSGEIDNCKKEIQMMSELTDKPLELIYLYYSLKMIQWLIFVLSQVLDL